MSCETQSFQLDSTTVVKNLKLFLKTAAAPAK